MILYFLSEWNLCLYFYTGSVLFFRSTCSDSITMSMVEVLPYLSIVSCDSQKLLLLSVLLKHCRKVISRLD